MNILSLLLIGFPKILTDEHNCLVTNIGPKINAGSRAFPDPWKKVRSVMAIHFAKFLKVSLLSTLWRLCLTGNKYKSIYSETQIQKTVLSPSLLKKHKIGMTMCTEEWHFCFAPRTRLQQWSHSLSAFQFPSGISQNALCYLFKIHFQAWLQVGEVWVIMSINHYFYEYAILSDYYTTMHLSRKALRALHE